MEDRDLIYNTEEYYQKHFKIPYDRREPHWLRFFGNIADKIIEYTKPKSALDFGCAKGFLVESFRDRGIDAYGIDISGYAISQVRADIRPFCKVSTSTDCFNQNFDIITCIEVLEHLTFEDSEIAIRNMTKASQSIFFSSPPEDFDDPTHINVHPLLHWLERFAEYGFYPDLSIDAGFIAPWAIFLKRGVILRPNDLLHHAAAFVNLRIERTAYLRKLNQLQTTIDTQKSVLEQKEKSLIELQSAINRIYASRGWRLLSKFYRCQGEILKNLSQWREQFLPKPVFSQDSLYHSWIVKREPDMTHYHEMKKEMTAWSHEPKISIISPVFNTDPYALTRCIESVLEQLYQNWELCLVNGGSNKPVVEKILQRYSKQDPRIITKNLPKNLGIAGNSNEALKMATGEYVAFLDHDDRIAPFALYEVVKLLNRDTSVDLIYSDEDKIPATSEHRYEPFFKPQWSPDTFLSYNYLCHFAVIRRSMVEEVGRLRSGYDGSQDYDLILRVIQKTDQIRHIPKILYHWRASGTSAALDPESKSYAYPAAKKAIGEYLSNCNREGEILDGFALGAYRIKYSIKDNPQISIIIPTKDKLDLLKQCVTSIVNKTTYRNFEILIIDNQSEEGRTHEYFNTIQNNRAIRVLRYDKPFNFSAINNYAAQNTHAPYLLFLNNDTEVISDEWLSAMLEFAQRDDVGAVGAKLYHTNDTVQHGGVIIGMGGVAAHAHRDFSRQSIGYGGRLNIVQNLSAVTAACMMLRRKVFEEVGGFDEHLSHAFNDVDLCLKIREKGYLVVWTPYAELYHHESASRGHDFATPEGKSRFVREEQIMRNRWKLILEAGDPYYNPNLTLDRPDFGLRT